MFLPPLAFLVHHRLDVRRRHLDLHFRAFLLQQQEHARIAWRPSRGLSPRSSLRERARSAASARRPRAPSSVASVTSLCARRSANSGGSNLPCRKLSAMRVERALAPERALADRRPQRQRLDAGLHAHGEHLGQRALNRVARSVVHQLRDRAGADRADVAHLVADRVEHLACIYRTRPCRRRPRSPACRSSRPSARR